MDRQNRVDPMSINVSNVFSPHRRIHVSEQLWDVDFTELGNPLVESHYENVYPGSAYEERDGANDINKDDSLM